MYSVCPYVTLLCYPLCCVSRSPVKTRVLLMKEQQMQLLTEIDNRYNMAIIKLPKAVRQMNWLLYFSKDTLGTC